MRKELLLGTMLVLLLVSVLAGAFKIQPVRSAGSAQMLLKTDKDSYLLGEIVTITLLNAGNETVDISEMPPWKICQYIFHQFVPVYPCIFLPVVWSLGPGQSRNYTWNQRNGFNGQPVGPGQYVVRDTQEWGLSAYFSIVPAIVVPDDYPTIQEAINNANEGDTVFVRSGTYYENVVVNKTISLIGERKETTVIYGDSTVPVLQIHDVRNITVREFSVCNGTGKNGVDCENLNYSTISDLYIVNNQRGIFLWNGTGDIIEGNEIEDFNFAIHTYDVCSYNVIENNTIRGSFARSARGIWIDAVNHENVSGNFVSHCTIGILPEHYAYDCRIENNTIDSNLNGIWLESVIWANTITNNIISNNQHGIALVNIQDGPNKIYHNNFINNGLQLYWWNGIQIYPIEWDNGCEGNYWSDYNGTDMNNDGVGDTELPWMNVDYYPLMNPYWNPADINHDLKIDVKDIYIVAKSYGTTSLGPNPEGYEWNPHCDINEDGKINMKDYYPVCKNYGKTYP